MVLTGERRVGRRRMERFKCPSCWQEFVSLRTLGSHLAHHERREKSTTPTTPPPPSDAKSNLLQHNSAITIHPPEDGDVATPGKEISGQDVEEEKPTADAESPSTAPDAQSKTELPSSLTSSKSPGPHCLGGTKLHISPAAKLAIRQTMENFVSTRVVSSSQQNIPKEKTSQPRKKTSSALKSIGGAKHVKGARGGVGALSCPLCPTRWRRSPALAKHLQAHSRPLGTCDFCSFRGDQLQMAVHSFVHFRHFPATAVSSRFSCHLCGLSFAVKAEFTSHLNRHYFSGFVKEVPNLPTN